jgi:membrane protease YdiL (CAAX protease family)
MPQSDPPGDLASKALTGKQVVATLLSGAATALLLLWTYRDSQSLKPPNPDAPPGALRLVVLMGILSALALVMGVFRRRAVAVAGSDSSTFRPKLRRPPRSMGWSLLMWQLLLGSLLFLYSSRVQWTYQSVGFDDEWSVLVSLMAGLIAYLVFIAVNTVVLRLLGRQELLRDYYLHVHAGLWPRQRSQKAVALIAICVLNPLLEELAFRGVLVYQFADAIGSRPLPIALGLAATLGNHSYQGLRAWWTHVPFYAIVVALLFSPAGLWGAVGFHVGGDALPIAALRSELREYRTRHRRVTQAMRS